MLFRRLGAKLPIVLAAIAVLLVLTSGVALAAPGHDDGSTATDDGHQDGSGLAWTVSIAGLFVAITAVPAAPTYWFGKQRDRVSDLESIHFLAVGLILFSAAVHLYLYFQHGELLMLLAGAGFLGAVVLFFLGFSRRILYLVGVAFVAVQLVLWAVSGMPHLQSYGLLDKIAQVLLLGVLGYLLWGEQLANSV